MGADIEPEDHALLAWVSLLRGHAALRRSIAAGLQEQFGLTISEYEALLMLQHAERQRLRGVDLAAGLQLTPSGVTRMLDGLRAGGLIEKAHCPDDARVTYAVLTSAGAAKAGEARCAHAKTVKAIFAERFSDQECAQLVALLGRLPGNADGHPVSGETECCGLGPATGDG